MVLRAVGAVLYSCSRSTCLICTATCPLTFTVELILSGSTRPRRWWTLQSLYAGWWRYLVMQSIGWAFWLTSLYLMLQQYWAPLRVPARDGVCAVLAVFAQLFMTQAGIVYAASCEQGAHVDKNKYAASAVVVLGFLWALVGLAIISVSEHISDATARLLYYVFALASMIVGALSTHGLGGRLRHGAVLITRGIQRRRRSSASLPSSPSFTSILGVKQHNDDDDGGGDGDDDGDGDDPTITGRSNSQEQGFDEMAASVPDQLEDAAAAGGDVTDGAIGASPTHSVDRIVDQDIVDQDINRKRTTKHDQKRTTMTSSSTPITSSTTQQGLGWSFFQPFRGGTLFIATQAVAWLFFATCLLLFGWAIYAAVLGVAHCVGCWAVATGLTMFATQVLLGTSLFLFRGGAAATRKAAAATRNRWLHLWAPIIIIYTPLHVYFALVACTCAFLPPPLAIAGWAAVHVFRVMWTAPLRPENTGACESRRFRGWLSQHLEPSLESWFGKFEVIRDGVHPPDPSQHYVFGYHPHGLFPCGAGYLPLTPSWQRLMPHIHPVTLTASVIFFPPVIRDLALATGLRQVTRNTFASTLQQRGSVVVVPGGQAELVHTWRHNAEFVTYSRHKGFVRLALQQRASLIPIIAFGEINSLRNLVNWPAALRWTYKRIGFPMPYFMVGRWGVSPFPAKTGGLTFIIGQPVGVADVGGGDGGGNDGVVTNGRGHGVTDEGLTNGLTNGGGQVEGGQVEGKPLEGNHVHEHVPTRHSAVHGTTPVHVDEATVARVHRAYYDQVEYLFKKYKSRFPGYACLAYVEEH